MAADDGNKFVVVYVLIMVLGKKRRSQILISRDNYIKMLSELCA